MKKHFNLDIFREVLETEYNSIKNVMNLTKSHMSYTKHFEDFLNVLYNTKGRIVVIGMGKSGYIAKKISATLSSTGSPSIFIHPVEAVHGDLGMISKDDTILMLSFSGETSEILELIPYFKKNNNPVLSITNSLTSTLAKNSKYTIPLLIDKEACSFNLAPTASSTTTLAVGDAIAITLMKTKGFSERDFAAYHPGGSLGRKLLTKVEDEMVVNDLPIVRPETNVLDVIYTISNCKMGVALVCDNNFLLLGIITDGDIRRSFELYKEKTIKLEAKNIMKLNPITVNGDMMVVDAEEIMNEKRIHQLIVINDNNQVIGILPYRQEIIKNK